MLVGVGGIIGKCSVSAEWGELVAAFYIPNLNFAHGQILAFTLLGLMRYKIAQLIIEVNLMNFNPSSQI